ncbi:hypothetical protein THIARS_70424 [Thiomonas delicata]|uniref:Uncharacterized protein n=1 Tax=Thiomonas delicata TaxID=364030 RepID=A0A238D6N2_THIDL|nr:hypothetical protein THIARS_70424 [Thiomonas delicata]
MPAAGQRCSRGTGFHTKLFEYMLKVLIHSARAHAKDVADIAVSLPLGKPGQHLRFPWRRKWASGRLGALKVGG